MHGRLSETEGAQKVHTMAGMAGPHALALGPQVDLTVANGRQPVRSPRLGAGRPSSQPIVMVTLDLRPPSWIGASSPARAGVSKPELGPSQPTLRVPTRSIRANTGWILLPAWGIGGGWARSYLT